MILWLYRYHKSERARTRVKMTTKPGDNDGGSSWATKVMMAATATTTVVGDDGTTQLHNEGSSSSHGDNSSYGDDGSSSSTGDQGWHEGGWMRWREPGGAGGRAGGHKRENNKVSCPLPARFGLNPPHSNTSWSAHHVNWCAHHLREVTESKVGEYKPAGFVWHRPFYGSVCTRTRYGYGVRVRCGESLTWG